MIYLFEILVQVSPTHFALSYVAFDRIALQHRALNRPPRHFKAQFVKDKMATLAETFLSPYLFICIPLLLLFGNAVTFVLSTLRPKGFPPGPSVLPGFGNLLQLDKKFPFWTYGVWAKIYGSDTPLGLKAANNNLVVLNSARLVHELFDKRGAIYSDRPHMYINDVWITRDDLKFVLAENASPWVLVGAKVSRTCSTSRH